MRQRGDTKISQQAESYQDDGPKLKIGIDATDIDMDMYKGGIYHYIINLISHLREIDDKNRYSVLFNYFLKYHKSNIEEAAKEIEGKNIQAKISRCPRFLRKKLHLPVNLFIGNVDIFHGPFDKMQPAIGCKKIITLHDMRYFELFPMKQNLVPELAAYDSSNKEFNDWNQFMNGMRKRVISAVQKTDYIITVSQYTKDALCRFVSIDPEKIFVVHNGISSIFVPVSKTEKLRSILNPYGVDCDYFLFVGHLDPLKNVLRMIDAYHSLKTRNKAAEHKLVLITPTPRENWFTKIVQNKIRTLSIENDVRIFHNIPGSTLPYFYSRATALLLPSLYEGFGIPVIEAMGCGTPVVLSDICSLPEVANDTAVFVNPYSADSIAEGILQILSDRELREDLSQRGFERSRMFNWKKTAIETLKVYRHVYNS